MGRLFYFQEVLMIATLIACCSAVEFDESEYSLPAMTRDGVPSMGHICVNNLAEVKEALVMQPTGLIAIKGKFYTYTWGGSPILSLEEIQYQQRVK
jgi:hypothetical protein